MTETLSTSKEIPKTRLALEEKYKSEPKEPIWQDELHQLYGVECLIEMSKEFLYE